MSAITISLTRGKVALIDDGDYQWLFQCKWHVHQDGDADKWYARRSVTVDGKRHSILMHRAILEHHGCDLTGKCVDHINGNGLDNRKENLRVVTKAENAYNRRKSPGHTSRYKGVYFDSQWCKWRASIKVNGKTMQLGRFLTQEEAARAYNEAASMYFGEFAHLNDVPMEILPGEKSEAIG